MGAQGNQALNPDVQIPNRGRCPRARQPWATSAHTFEGVLGRSWDGGGRRCLGAFPAKGGNSSHQSSRRNPPLFPSMASPLTPRTMQTLGESPEPGPDAQPIWPTRSLLWLPFIVSPSAWPCGLSPGPRINSHLSLWPLQGRYYLQHRGTLENCFVL